MKVAVISMYPFPIGMAATNRILAYSKGLIENNTAVDIFIPFPTSRKENKTNHGDHGTYYGINYFYTNGRYSHNFKIIRAISILSGYRKISGFYKTCQSIIRLHNKCRYQAIILSSDQILSIYVYSLLSKYLKVPLIFIFDEFPTPIRHKLKTKIPPWKVFFYKKVLNKVHAYISISNELKDYYNSFCQKNTFVLPVITDISRFVNLKSSSYSENSNYICYMGNMELSKDNIDVIIKGFSRISSKHPELELHLFGPPNKYTQKILNELIVSLEMTEKIKFKGVISSELVPQVLSNAKILVSSQPDTIRASGGFPTKLGEYLASGVPALLTDVGENSRYVKNDMHIFFSEPNNPEKYAERLSYILENYELAKQIAMNGKQFLFENFSHIAMGKKLSNFINTIKYV